MARRDMRINLFPLLCIVLTPVASHAQWTGSESDDFSDTRNWIGGQLASGSIDSLGPSGNGAILTGPNDITLGAVGVGIFAGSQGRLTIKDGGKLTLGNIQQLGQVANDTGAASGEVIVRGSGSSLTANGGMRLGAFGTGILTVSDGASVTSSLIEAAYTSVLATRPRMAIINVGEGGAAGILNVDEIRGGNGNATLNFNHTTADYDFGASITQRAGHTGQGLKVNHLGSGSTILTGTNLTYTGDTTISAGALVFAADTVNLGGNVVVGGGGTAAFNSNNATIAGNVTIGSGSKFSLGEIGAASIRDALNLTVNGNFTLASGATLDMGLGVASDAVDSYGVGDLIKVSGNLDLSGTLNLFNFNEEAVLGGRYEIFHYGTFTGTPTLVVEGGVTPTIEEGSVGAGVSRLILNFATELGEESYWMGNDGAGGDGTWNSTDVRWSSSSNGGGTQAEWNGAKAIFQGLSGGHITVAEPIAFTGLDVDNGEYIFSSGGADAALVATRAEGQGNAVVLNAFTGATSRIDTVLRAADPDVTLTKDGDGTLILSNAGNQWTGPITVARGVLQIEGSGAGSPLPGGVIVQGNGTLAFKRDNYVYGGVIGGTNPNGRVIQRAGATTILTGASTYGGLTTIESGGTLQLGNGGSTGSIGGGTVHVENGGTLAFNRSNNLTFSNTLTGSGDIVQRGAASSVVTLDGTMSSFTGKLLVESGLFNLGKTVGGSLTFGGSLDLSGGSTLTVAPGSTISGAVNVNGGTLNVGIHVPETGPTTRGILSGPVTVTNGTLIANGYVNGATTLNNGGILRGTGRAGNVAVGNGGTLSPGNSIGTLAVNGNLVFQTGATYEVEATNLGAADRVNVTGDVTLDGIVSILGGPNSAMAWNPPLNEYIILTYTGTRTGSFETFEHEGGSSTHNLPFLTPSLEYGNGVVTLHLDRNDIRFADVGLTRNQRAAGAALESMGLVHPVAKAGVSLHDAAVYVGSSQEAQAAFDAVSGEVHASIAGMLLDDSRLLRDAVLDQAYFNDGRHVGTQVWMRALGQSGKAKGDGVSDFKRDAIGAMMGVDYQLGDGAYSIGWAAGYHTNASAKTNALLSESDANNTHVAIYGATRQDSGLGVRLGASYTWHEMDVERTVVFSGLPDESVKTDYKGNTLQTFGEMDWRMNLGDGLEVAPFIGLAWTRLETDSFMEADFLSPIGSTAALGAAAQKHDASFATLGARGLLAMSSVLQVQGMLGYRRTLSGDDPSVRLGFLDGGQRFDVVGAPLSRDAMVADVGLSLVLGEALTLGAAYNGQIGNDRSDHAIQARLIWALE